MKIGRLPSAVIIGLFAWYMIASHKDEYATGAVENAAVLSWQYENYSDQMGRGTVKEATILSENQVEFGSPYRGAQRATLTLRQHPKYGKDIILTIERGQFLCRLDGCAVSVKFGEGKAETFSAGEPDDHRTTALFIQGYDRFLKSAKNAQIVRIEAPFFRQGTQVFVFQIQGLSW